MIFTLRNSDIDNYAKQNDFNSYNNFLIQIITFRKTSFSNLAMKPKSIFNI